MHIASTGVQLWIYGVQRCHRWKCDSFFGNRRQVIKVTSLTDIVFLIVHVVMSADCVVVVVLLPGCWAKNLTQERKRWCYTKSPHREKDQDVAEQMCLSKKSEKWWNPAHSGHFYMTTKSDTQTIFLIQRGVSYTNVYKINFLFTFTFSCFTVSTSLNKYIINLEDIGPNI